MLLRNGSYYRYSVAITGTRSTQVAEIFGYYDSGDFKNFRTPIEIHPSVSYHFAVKLVIERAHSLRGADEAA
jgi:hypothetical protein